MKQLTSEPLAGHECQQTGALRGTHSAIQASSTY